MFIEFKNVNKTYKPDVQALKDASFKINKGEFVFVIGESGSGKSTVIKLLTCEERASSGEIFLEGYNIVNVKKRQVSYLRRNIGMIFQDFRLIPSKTVYENVAFAMEIIGLKKSVIKKRVPMVLSTVSLRHKAKMYPHQLSGGEQQRVAIARAMVNDPALILADEPTGNLDPINSEAVMALLQEINDGGTTVIVCSHDANMVNKLRKRVIEISNGYIVRDDKSGEYNLTPDFSALQGRQGRRSRIRKTKSTKDISEQKISDQEENKPVATPFVRNVELKFADMDFKEEIDAEIKEDSDKTELSVSADKTDICRENADREEISLLDKAKEEEILSTAIDDSAQEALRIAVEYYMRKARECRNDDETDLEA